MYVCILRLSVRVCMFILWLCVFGRFDCFFFFKQKTAYEVRISDWSSDVCSSDLEIVVTRPDRRRHGRQQIGPDAANGISGGAKGEIGRASCRERVCQYV